MATLARRGTGTPATTGTTWATVTNAVDGAAGTNPATYATMTSTTASAVATIEVTGYSFSDTIASGDTLNSVSVALRHFENNTGRFASVTFQAFDGATAIGTATTCTLATGARTDTATVSATLAQVRSSTFKIRVTITGAASTQSRVFSIDQVDVTADYTPLPPTITQASYRWYDEGTETGAVALAAQDTAATGDVTVNDGIGQLRVRLQSTNAGVLNATDDYQLQWEKNASGTWTNVVSNLVTEYSDTNRDNQASLGGSTPAVVYAGGSFLGTGTALARVGFFLRRSTTANPGTISAQLFAHSGTFGTSSVGTGAALATSTNTLTISSIQTGTFAWFYFDFDGTFTLTNTTPYVIALQTTQTLDTFNVVHVGNDLSSPTYPGNACDANAALTWVARSSDLVFRVYGPASTAVLGYDSPNLTEGAVTTNRLTGGTGTFVAGKVSEDGLVDDLSWSANNYTELLYALAVQRANVVNGDTLRFRVLRNGSTTGMTYSVTPTINVLATAGVSATGIATTLAFGTPTIAAGAVNTTLTGIASTVAFGTPVVAGTAADQNINTTAVATSLAFGTTAVAAGTANITATGISSTLAFGTAAVVAGAVTATVTGISSTLTFGTATVAAGAVARTTTGITSTVTFGTTSVAGVGGQLQTILPAGITSTLAFGTTTIAAGDANRTTTGIGSTVAFGTVSVTAGAVAPTLTGIGSTVAFGATAVVPAGTANIIPTGISSTLTFGTVTFAPGAVTRTVTGLSSSLTFGTPLVIPAGTQALTTTAIGSTLAFGAVTVRARSTSTVNIVWTVRFTGPKWSCALMPD